jgi:hypothetical protein
LRASGGATHTTVVTREGEGFAEVARDDSL